MCPYTRKEINFNILCGPSFLEKDLQNFRPLLTPHILKEKENYGTLRAIPKVDIVEHGEAYLTMVRGYKFATEMKK